MSDFSLNLEDLGNLICVELNQEGNNQLASFDYCLFTIISPKQFVMYTDERHPSCWRHWAKKHLQRRIPINLRWLAGNCIFVMSIRCASTWIKAEWASDGSPPPKWCSFHDRHCSKVTKSYRDGEVRTPREAWCLWSYSCTFQWGPSVYVYIQPLHVVHGKL